MPGRQEFCCQVFCGGCAAAARKMRRMLRENRRAHCITEAGRFPPKRLWRRICPHLRAAGRSLWGKGKAFPFPYRRTVSIYCF